MCYQYFKNIFSLQKRKLFNISNNNKTALINKLFQPNSVCLYMNLNLAVFYWLWFIIKIYIFSGIKLCFLHYCPPVEIDRGREHARTFPAAVLLACGDASLIHPCSSSWKNPLCWGVSANVWKSQPEPIPSWWVSEWAFCICCWGVFVTVLFCNAALMWLLRVYTEASGGHVCSRAPQTQTAASL